MEKNFVKYLVGKNGLYVGEHDFKIPGGSEIEFDGANAMIYNSKEYAVGNLRGAIKVGWIKRIDGEKEEKIEKDAYQKKNEFIQEQAKKKYKFDQYDVDQSQAEDNVVEDFKKVDKITENSVYKKREIVQTSDFKGQVLQDDENQGEVVGDVNNTLKDNEIKIPEGYKKFSKKQKEEFINNCEDLKTLRYLKDKEFFGTKRILNERLKQLGNK